MQTNKLTILLLALTISCTEQNNKVDNSISLIPKINNEDSIPEVIKGLPVGIYVINEPFTIYAELNNKPESKYIWRHTTTIKALSSNLRIVEFGTYNYKNGKWQLGNYTKKPFTTDNFDKWYCRKGNGIITFDFCKSGKIIKNEEYIDPSNYSIRNDSLVNRNGLWYYIGIDSTGKKMMGYGRYVAINKLKVP